MMKTKYFRYENFTGHNNEKIFYLTDNLNRLKIEVDRIRDEINLIQENCEHEYYFSSQGMFDDCYHCIKCGHENWK